MTNELIARIWRSNIDLGSIDDYEQFARERSLPMFRRQHGFVGALMLRDESECQVITLWRGRASVALLDSSPQYRHTVRLLKRLGMLRGEQTVELTRAHLFAAEPLPRWLIAPNGRDVPKANTLLSRTCPSTA